MGGHDAGVAALIARRAQQWDRFARWPRAGALAVLLAFAALLVAASLTYPAKFEGRGFTVTKNVTGKKRDTDLMLYEAIAGRVAKGENYYRAAFVEQRARHFPVTPGLTVRLPTFAYLTAWLGRDGLITLAAALMLAIIVAWWRRMGEEPGGPGNRLLAVPLLVASSYYLAGPHYWMLHEAWCGLFLTLAFGLHRPGRWKAAWVAAACALAIRELALPFVLLLGAMALWRRDWREAGAWALLTLLFVAVIAWHFSQIAALVLPSDKPSPPWLVMRGLAGWTSNLVLSSYLARLPRWLAPIIVCLPLLGWAGWRSAAGLTGFLLHTGYLITFMFAGRDNNFYWGLMLSPSLAIGLAFFPRALWSLLRVASGRAQRGGLNVARVTSLGRL